MRDKMQSILDDETLGANIEDRKELLEAIFDSKKVILVTYSLTDVFEHKLNFVLSAVLKKHDLEFLQGSVYTCVKELVVNATKANAKHVYFKEKNVDIENETEYAKALQEMKEKISEEWIHKYGQMAKAMNYEVRIIVQQTDDAIRIDVINNLPMMPVDEKRIYEVLKKGNQYNDLVDFYMNHGDQTEGEGIGLVMNMLLLKGEGIPIENFSIQSHEGLTQATLGIPIRHSYPAQN